MRIPIILMLLTVLLLPADLQGLAQDVEAGMHTVTTAATKLVGHRDVQVAEAEPLEVVVKASVTR